jgi:integrase
VAATGVRIGEAAALAWSDVDVEERTVVIRRAVRLESGGRITLTTPKAGSTRKIEITRELVELIKAHRVKVAEAALARGVPAPDIAFPTPSGTLADPNNLRRWLRQVSTKAKVEMPGFHALRHASHRHSRMPAAREETAKATRKSSSGSSVAPGSSSESGQTSVTSARSAVNASTCSDEM